MSPTKTSKAWDEIPEPIPIDEVTSERAWPEYDGMQAWLKRLKEAQVQELREIADDLKSAEAGVRATRELVEAKIMILQGETPPFFL